MLFLVEYNLVSKFMCGRFIQALDTDELTESLASLGYGLLLDSLSEVPRQNYNLAPTQSALVLTPEGGAALGATVAQWGFPGFSTSPGKRPISPINARGETLLSNRYFRGSVQKNRCIIPANGYYEWRKSPPPSQPFLIGHDLGIIYFAGLLRLDTLSNTLRFVVVTTQSHPGLIAVHDRQPIVLTKEAFPLWASGGHFGDKELAAVLPPQELGTRRISTRVNSPAHNDPALMLPSEEN